MPYLPSFGYAAGGLLTILIADIFVVTEGQLRVLPSLGFFMTVKAISSVICHRRKDWLLKNIILWAMV